MTLNLIKKGIYSFATCIALLASAASYAAITKTTICNYCSNITNYEYAAEQAAGGTPSINVYVINNNTEVIKKFNLYKQRDLTTSMFGPYTITQQNVESSKQQEYDLFLSAKADLNHSPDTITVFSSLAATAWDMAGSSSKQNTVIDYILDDMGKATYALAFIKAAAVISLDIDKPTFDVKFIDGSVATFRIEGFDANLGVKIKLAEAKDSSQNSIPLSKAELKNSYRVSNKSPSSGINPSISNALIRLAQSGGSGDRYKTVFKCNSEAKCTMTLKQIPWD